MPWSEGAEALATAAIARSRASPDRVPQLARGRARIGRARDGAGRHDEDAQPVRSGARGEGFVRLAALGPDAGREEPGAGRGRPNGSHAFYIVARHYEADRVRPGGAFARHADKEGLCRRLRR